MGVLRWLFGTRQRQAYQLPEIPQEFYKTVEEADPFDYFCSGCGFQTNEQSEKCPHCGRKLVKTGAAADRK